MVNTTSPPCNLGCRNCVCTRTVDRCTTGIRLPLDLRSSPAIPQKSAGREDAIRYHPWYPSQAVCSRYHGSDMFVVFHLGHDEATVVGTLHGDHCQLPTWIPPRRPPVVQFSVTDDTEEQYTFVSKQRRGEDSTAVGASVDVLYNAADPTQAEIVQRLQQEASGLFRLSLLILSAAAVLICLRSIALQHIEMMNIQQQEDSTTTYESMDRNANGRMV